MAEIYISDDSRAHGMKEYLHYFSSSFFFPTHFVLEIIRHTVYYKVTVCVCVCVCFCAAFLIWYMLCVQFEWLELTNKDFYFQARLFDEPQLASLCLDTIDKSTGDAINAESFTDVDLGM